MQALSTYKRETAALCGALGHRDKSLLEDIASRATVFSWRELLGLLPGRPDDPDAQRVLNELNRRI
jgi:hypothetical protein